MKKIFTKLIFSGFLAGILFFLFGFFTLKDYNINWDTINHLPRGQAYLHYFLTGRQDFNDLPKWTSYFQDPRYLSIHSNLESSKVPRRSLYESDGTTFNWFMQHDGNGHPPLSDILSALFNQIFFNQLRLVNDIDSYHIYGIFLAAILVGLVFYWASKVYGKFAGLIASLSLALYPLFWSESHFNTEKDVPEAVYFSLVLFFTWLGVTKKKWVFILVSGIFLGLALGTKFNVLFLAFVILPWFVINLLTKYQKEKLKLVKFLLGYKWIFISGIVAILLGISIFIISWPFLWPDIITRVEGVLRFYKQIGTEQDFRPEYLTFLKFNTYPFKWIIYTTPIVILIMVFFGLISVVRRVKKELDTTSLLFLLWLIIPILRVSWPGSNIYGGIRQIMEYVPALALISGLGAQTIYDFLYKNIRIRYKNILIAGFILLCFVPIIIRLVQFHPNENVYFNPLIGGLNGAKNDNLFSWGNSFGAAYRQAIIWVNENADNNSKLVFTYEHAPNLPSIFIRPDLELQNHYRSGYLMLGEYAISLYRDSVIGRSYYDDFLDHFVNPVYEAKVDGVPVVKVWKNSPEYLKQPIVEKIDKEAKLLINDSDLTVIPSGDEKIWRVEMEYTESDQCEKVKHASVFISVDGTTFHRQNVNLPQDYIVSINGPEPADGKFIHPFLGEVLKAIKISFEPENSCFKNVKGYRLYYLP